MTTTQEILAEAHKLGKLIKDHPSVNKLEEAVEALKQDNNAQRTLNDYNRFATQLSEKEQKGEPIEADEKHKLQDLHKAVVMSKVLQAFQVAQMDYSDLMRQIDAAMTAEISPQPTQPSQPATSPSDNTGQSASGQSSIIQ